MCADSLAFLPDRIHAIDADFKQQLTASLELIANELDATEVKSAVTRCAKNLTQTKPTPAIYAAYYNLIYCLADPDSNDVVDATEQLSRAVAAKPGARIVMLGNPDQLEFSALLMAMIDTDPSERFVITPASRADFQQFKAETEVALTTLAKTVPEIAGEMDVLAQQIVAAAPGVGSQGEFDGASTYMCWGAIVLNCTHKKTRLQQLETLVHESSHNLLFGLSLDKPLCDTSGARYPSPLRETARPLEGIIHASFVSARMALFLTEYRDRGGLVSGESAELDMRLKHDWNNVRDGLTVLRNAPLTEFGVTIVDDLERACPA